jgi:hypothetical protein
MSLTSLVIKSKSNPPAAEYTWEKIGNIETFTKEIITPAIGGENEGAGNVGSIVSGVPTIFARANMFRNAIDNVVDKDMSGSGLIHFYKYLIDEWRGLIACIALNHEKIEVKRINLTYSDGKSTENTENLYEPKGSFGNMLFERTPLWSNPNDVDSTPYIDIILFTKSNGKQIVVGGTTPDSFFFTSVAYDLAGENSTYVKEEKTEGKVVGKFTDPLKRSIDPQSLNKLKSYVNHIVKGTNKFKEFFNNVTIPFEFENVIGNLTTWVSEMDKYALDKGYAAPKSEEIPQVSNFKAPYSILLNYSTNVAGFNGVIYAEGAPEDAVEFNPNELLLPEDTTIACIDDDGNPNYLQNRPLLLLKADVKGEPNECRHFMLPLSPKGIKVFGNRLSTVLGIKKNAADIKTRITAIYDPNTSNLTVKLSLFSQTSPLGEIKKVYKTTEDDIFGKDILLWPNFVSKKWEKYFLYSEMPHNSSNWQAIPFCGNLNSQNFDIIMSTDDPELPALIAKGGKETDLKSAHLKVELSRNVDGTNYEYEIFESKNPFKGFQMLHQNKLCGYAVIEYGNTFNDSLHVIDDLENLKEAHLGVDFGSTNSAIAYRVGDIGEVEGFTFNNRRVSLLDTDEKDNTIKPAGEDEIFFFQNDEIESNQIKSILSLHDTRRMKDSNGQGNLTALASEYVKGGFPCFEKNLPIEDRTDTTYILNFGDAKGSIGQSTLIHSMKWSGNGANQEMEESYRKAYLSSLLLQVYADLFAKKLYPSSLKWSYPSAMGDNLIGSYNQIWNGLKVVNPLSEGHALTIKQGMGNLVFDSDGDGDTWGKSSNDVDNQETSNNSDDSGWGSVSDSGDWGASESTKTQPEQNSGGWGDEKLKIAKTEDIQIDDNPITFDFQEIDDNFAMTESCAVANFLAQKGDISKSQNSLTICFDIGGSTTDILVLGQMMGPTGMGLSMVKQSSIRFAAQRVAQATKYSPNFKSVLIELLDKKGIKLEGINKGANKYTENTAPYYFEQLVDRLTDHEFDEFYKLLGAKCKEMVSVNVYITGLIVYYAGQIAKKVKLEIDKSPNKTSGWGNPKIQIQFTGKGSRIMDWLKAINPQADKKYYMDMFINGFGGMEAAKQHLGGPPIFQNRANENSDVKYEVAKGLASTTDKLYIPKTDQKPLEVIGEDGFELIYSSGQSTKLDSESTINALMMESIGANFMLRPENNQKPCPKFMQFAHLYFQLATNYFGLKASQQDFMNGFQSMNISDYIRQMPEFKMAQRNTKGFDFVAPIIILEGMQFFENVILKKIAQK